MSVLLPLKQYHDGLRDFICGWVTPVGKPTVVAITIRIGQDYQLDEKYLAETRAVWDTLYPTLHIGAWRRRPQWDEGYITCRFFPGDPKDFEEVMG